MTVIRRKQQNYNYQNSNNTSDTESLNLASASVSDAESINNEPIAARAYGNYQIRKLCNEEANTLKKNPGRRKFRRYHNRCLLETLSEEEEDAVNLTSSCKSPLSRLLEDEDALQYWNEFIEKTEEDQEAIIKSYSAKIISETGEAKCTHPFYRISSKIRRTIKIRKNLTVQFVQNCEIELVEFFKKTPRNIFKKNPPNSFERLLFHALAQYHSLNSTSNFEGGRRVVEIHNSSDNWTPSEHYLFNVIAEQRG